MEVVKKTDDYVIFQKASKRYAVRDASRKWISGDEKVKILVQEKLLNVPAPKPKVEAPTEDAAPAENAEEVAAAE